MCNKKINVSILLKNYYYNFIKFLKRITTHKNKNWQQTKGKKSFCQMDTTLLVKSVKGANVMKIENIFLLKKL